MSKESKKAAQKAETLIQKVLSCVKKNGEDPKEPPVKKVKINDDTNEEQNPGGQDSTSSTSMTCIWVKLNSYNFSLSNMEKDISVNEEMLSDLHINFAQTLLKQQFEIENGLNSTVLQSKVPNKSSK